MSRFERNGRATLRKAQAIEDDDHLAGVNSQPSIDTNTTTSSVPSLSLAATHGLPSKSNSSFEDDDAFSKTSHFAQLLNNTVSSNAIHQLPAPIGLSSSNALPEALRLLLQHRQNLPHQSSAVKHEPMPNDQQFPWVAPGAGDLSTNLLFNFASQPSFNLSIQNLMQSQSLDLSTSTDDFRVSPSGSTASSAFENRKPHSFDMSKFADTRNINSTESNASTSSEPAYRGSDMPRKSVIQEDIRMNKGRFKLVRKRGRSDVWNLFGQVMDNVTGQRLPYVACYACKVLYTDTGGGTGNMTRHRCPLGASYRSISSSTETFNESFHVPSSFDSYHGPSPEAEKDALNVPCIKAEPVTAPITTITHPLPISQTLAHHQSLQSQMSTISSAGSATMQASSSSTESIPPGFPTFGGSFSIDVPMYQNTGNSAGPALTADISPVSSLQCRDPQREYLLRGIAEFCINDFELPEVVNNQSFVNLLENVYQCGRRSQHLQLPKSFALLMPTAYHLSSFIKDQCEIIRTKLRMYLQNFQEHSIMLVCQQMKYGTRDLISVWASFINESWTYERVCLAAKFGDVSLLAEFLSDVAKEYGFYDAEKILIVLDDSFPMQHRPQLMPNMQYVSNVVHAINEILVTSINECKNLSQIQKMITTFQQAVYFAGKEDECYGVRHHLISPARSTQVIEEDSKKLKDALTLYQLLKFVREKHESLKKTLIEGGKRELACEIDAHDFVVANNLEIFLEPFDDVGRTFDSDAEPHFHTILPEWHALIHECASVDEEDDNADQSHRSNQFPVSLFDRSRRRSLRHQKSVDDEPLLIVDDEHESTTGDNKASWMKELRQRVEQRLRAWAKDNITVDHMIATALNPRMRKLPIICDDSERMATYASIRQLAKLKKVVNECRPEQSEDYEPLRKRQNFLSKLEDQGMAEDELDIYLNLQFTPIDGNRAVSDFWSKNKNLPKLSEYARFVLPTVAAAPPLELINPSNLTLSDQHISDYLLLKTSKS